jgi:hypothetical protein
MAKRPSFSSLLGLFSDGSPIGSRDGAEYFTSTSSLLFPILFWTYGMSVMRALHAGSVIGGFNGASARTLLQPLCTKDFSESFESSTL